MGRTNGLNRRAFLQNAGMTALLGAVGAHTSAAEAVVSGVAAPPDGRYDFDTVYNRIGTDSVKWDQAIRTWGKENIEVGMGIADMDFRAAPAITKALAQRLQHENWGYISMPESFTRSLIDWNKRRYNVEIDPKNLMLSAGVHAGLISALQAFSPPGTKVLLQPPTYNAFYSTDIPAARCTPAENPLKLVNGRYSMDFEDLERRIDNDTHTLILCNPQNPTGNCWSREDLLTLGEICLKRRVVVLADEIHCDFVTKGQTYTPFSSLPNEAVVRNSITFKSASKSFGLAAMKAAYLYSSNPEYMDRIRKAGLRQDINTLGVVAHQAAYNEGEDWLNQCVAYIDGNLDFVEAFLRANVPSVKFVKPQGTYLAWLDLTSLAERIGTQELAAEANRTKAPTAPVVTPERILEQYLVKHAKIHVNAGSSYGMGGANHVRMNVATSRKLVAKALQNLANAVKNPQMSRA